MKSTDSRVNHCFHLVIIFIYYLCLYAFYSMKTPETYCVGRVRKEEREKTMKEKKRMEKQKKAYNYIYYRVSRVRKNEKISFSLLSSSSSSSVSSSSSWSQSTFTFILFSIRSMEIDSCWDFWYLSQIEKRTKQKRIFIHLIKSFILLNSFEKEIQNERKKYFVYIFELNPLMNKYAR